MEKPTRQLNQKFATVLNQYQGLVYSIIYAVCADAGDAWDLTQEVFVKAWQCEEFFNADFKQRAWLCKVARNEALKRRRSLVGRCRYLLRYCGFEEATAPSELEERLLHDERVSRLRSLLATLDEDERQIIALRFSADLSYKEIAETMEIKIGTVMSRLARLKEKLGAGFEEEEI